MRLRKKDGGLGICNLSIIDKALLGKWNWRFATQKGSHMETNYNRECGEEDGGWYSRGVRGGYVVGVWKAIRNEWEAIKSSLAFYLGMGEGFNFGKIYGLRIKF